MSLKVQSHSWVILNPLSSIKVNSLIIILKDFQLQNKNAERKENKNLMVNGSQDFINL